MKINEFIFIGKVLKVKLDSFSICVNMFDRKLMDLAPMVLEIELNKDKIKNIECLFTHNRVMIEGDIVELNGILKYNGTKLTGLK